MASPLALLTLILAAMAVVALEARTLYSPRRLSYPLMVEAARYPRAKRQSYRMIYPQRTLMFTGFYRPARQSSIEPSNAGGVYAQGSSVGGGAFFEPQPAQSPQFIDNNGPPAVVEPELSLSDAEAAPEPPADDQNNERPVEQDSGAAQEDAPKKNKKVPIPEAEDEYDEEEEMEEDELPGLPHAPFRPPVKQRKNKPYYLNNLFPVVFSMPAGAYGRRAGSSGIPGLVTAVANSYSTGKGGVASSLATAYGGNPTKKPKRQSAN